MARITQLDVNGEPPLDADPERTLLMFFATIWILPALSMAVARGNVPLAPY